MNEKNTKALVVNVITVVVVFGMLGVGYVVFFKKEGVVTEVATIQEAALETVAIHAEIKGVREDLESLNDAVGKAKEFFANAAFQDLVDRSTNIPHEAVSRDNPFIVPKWKTDLERSRSATHGGQGASVSSAQTASGDQAGVVVPDYGI